MARRSCLLSALGALLLVGCGQDVTPFYDESIAIKQAYTAELEKIEDVATAEAAIAELEKLSDRYQAWEDSIKGVVMTVNDYDKHKDRIEPALDALTSELRRAQDLLFDEHADLAAKIGELCKGPINH